MKNRIWLTGDVHHMTMNGHDQKLLIKNGSGYTEVELCAPYLEIANQYGFEPTLFFTGKAILEEGNTIKELMNKYNLFIGGHTFSAYRPNIISRISNKIISSPYINRYSQYLDIKKTQVIIEDNLGIITKKWRNHAYRTDRHTYQILSELGFLQVSNEVNQEKYYEEKVCGDLCSLPIDTLPDHENLLHSTEHEGGLQADEWVRENIKCIQRVMNRKGVATLLLHPLCMYLEDDFNSMERLLSAFSY